MDELKLCPFCGEQHNWETGEDAHYGSGKYIICRNRIIMQAHNNAEIDSRTEHYNTRPLEDALTAEVSRLSARVAELEGLNSDPVCEWSCESDWDSDTWNGKCGTALVFDDGGPDENGYNYCPGCGRRMVIIITPPEAE